MELLAIETLRLAIYSRLIKTRDRATAGALSTTCQMLHQEMRSLLWFLRKRKDANRTQVRLMALLAAPLIRPLLVAATECQSNSPNVKFPSELALALSLGEAEFQSVCSRHDFKPSELDYWRYRALLLCLQVGYEKPLQSLRAGHLPDNLMRNLSLHSQKALTDAALGRHLRSLDPGPCGSSRSLSKRDALAKRPQTWARPQ